MSSVATEVMLHCVICFEEFCNNDRPPVVLPCGHTYVCMVCAKRLTKCMECREPLFWTPPAPKIPHINNGLPTRSPAPYRYGVRGRYSPGPQTPPHPAMATPPQKEEPVPLPLPKNAVLMAMIDSANRQRRLLEEAQKEEVVGSKAASDDASNVKLDPVVAGASAFVGSCGTYAVRESLGLAVLPFDPNKQHHSGQEPLKEIVSEEKKTDESKEPFTVEKGQKVQVVSADEGVYQLARGTGFIVASVNQLVKVGGPQEKSCELEGMLQSVTRKQEDLQKALDEVNILAHGLRDKIQMEQDHPPEFPVISAPPEEPILPSTEKKTGRGPDSDPSTPPHLTARYSRATQGGLELTESNSSTEVGLGNGETYGNEQGNMLLYSPAHSCPMPDPTVLDPGLNQPFMDDQPAGLPRYRVNSDDDLHALNWAFGCGTSLFGERLLEHDVDTSRNVMALSFDDSLVDGDAVTLGGQSRATVQTSGARTVPGTSLDASGAESPLRSGSFDGVNWRTGLSGHSGLTHSRNQRNSPSGFREIRMMSAHRGVAAARGAGINRGSGRRTPNQQYLGHNID